MKGKRLAVIVSMLSGSGFAADLGRDAFVYQAPIEINEAGTIYRAPLTLPVYQAVTRADLRDMRVYNGDGEVVPHGIRRPSIESGRKLADLAVFPVPMVAGGAPNDVSLFVATDPAGSVIAIKTTPARAAERSAYIVDASRTQAAIAALELAWDDSMPEKHFVGVLAIEASDDLKHWRDIGRGAVANLYHERKTLSQRRIAISPQRLKYLRLTWIAPDPNIALVQVKAEVRATLEPERDWLALASDGDADIGEHRFELSGKMPVDRARVPLPTNSVAHVSVWSRNRAGDPWMQRGRKTVFTIVAAEQTLHDTEIALQPSTDRYWLLRFDEQADVLGRTPALELGWIPHDLIFVTRGPPPFVLAAGSSRAMPAGNYGIEELLQRARSTSIGVSNAKLGAAERIERSRGRIEWEQWLLWSVLVVGVGGLVGLAVRLGRRLGRPTE